MMVPVDITIRPAPSSGGLRHNQAPTQKRLTCPACPTDYATIGFVVDDDASIR